jgi:hypothetical protein
MRECLPLVPTVGGVSPTGAETTTETVVVLCAPEPRMAAPPATWANWPHEPVHRALDEAGQLADPQRQFAYDRPLARVFLAGLLTPVIAPRQASRCPLDEPHCQPFSRTRGRRERDFGRPRSSTRPAPAPGGQSAWGPRRLTTIGALSGAWQAATAKCVTARIQWRRSKEPGDHRRAPCGMLGAGLSSFGAAA